MRRSHTYVTLPACLFSPQLLLPPQGLVGIMMPRALKTRRVWPAGLVTVLGWGSAGYELLKTVEWWDA